MFWKIVVIMHAYISIFDPPVLTSANSADSFSLSASFCSISLAVGLGRSLGVVAAELSYKGAESGEDKGSSI